MVKLIFVCQHFHAFLYLINDSQFSLYTMQNYDKKFLKIRTLITAHALNYIKKLAIAVLINTSSQTTPCFRYDVVNIVQKYQQSKNETSAYDTKQHIAP